jgi:uncharacterized surface protein with fasciclin (FAS1) repeats
MKATKLLSLAILLVSMGSFLAVQAQEHPTKKEHPSKTEHPAKEGGIVSVAMGAGHFKTFLAAVKTCGLEDKLQSKGPFTIFAPTDEAFENLPAGTLDDLLKPANKAMLAGLLANHVVPGKILAKDIKSMKATNVSGVDLDIKVNDGVVTVNNAKVVQADISATNGVIHAIDTVLIPAPTAEKASSEHPKDHPAH